MSRRFHPQRGGQRRSSCVEGNRLYLLSGDLDERRPFLTSGQFASSRGHSPICGWVAVIYLDGFEYPTASYSNRSKIGESFIFNPAFRSNCLLCHNFARTILHVCVRIGKSTRSDRLQTHGFIQLTTNSDT